MGSSATKHYTEPASLPTKWYDDFFEKLDEEIASYESRVDSSGTASGPEGQTRGDKDLRFCRLTQHKNKVGDVTSMKVYIFILTEIFNKRVVV